MTNRDLDQSDYERSGEAASEPRSLTVRDIAEEIAAYLPNPGQFMQAIVTAFRQDDSDSVVLLETSTGQSFRLVIEEVILIDGQPTDDLDDDRDAAIIAAAHSELAAELAAEDAAYDAERAAHGGQLRVGPSPA